MLHSWASVFVCAFLTIPAVSTRAFAEAQSQAPQSPASQPKQKTFSSPQEAAAALYSAARNKDENALLAILGPDAIDIIHWTDNADDRKAECEQFAKKYDAMHRLVKEPDDETTLYVGVENWPLPIPLVENKGAWYFDTSLGKREILYRRIGENELQTIDVLRAVVEAQKEYYGQSPGGDGAHVYAARFDSREGAHDGLYWPSSGNSPESPIGPYLARASYDRSDRMPYGGYYFRILTAQGPNAPGGAKSYMANGKMTAGFAVIAVPAEYGSSGVKTFMVSEDGVVYEKDLGPMTTQVAASIKAFNPDPTWHKLQ
jgi:hypothetical protein